MRPPIGSMNMPYSYWVTGSLGGRRRDRGYGLGTHRNRTDRQRQQQACPSKVLHVAASCRSADAYGLGIDESAFKANPAVLAQLRSYGWTYAIIDEGWYMKEPAGANLEAREYQLDRHGLLIPALNRFPSAARAAGLRPLADWIHHHGLKLGIHIVRGIPRQAVRENLPIADSKFQAADAADIADTCPWDEGNYGVRDNKAGQAYYNSMFKLYAAWKIDFVKVDCIANRPSRYSTRHCSGSPRPDTLQVRREAPAPIEITLIGSNNHFARAYVGLACGFHRRPTLTPATRSWPCLISGLNRRL